MQQSQKQARYLFYNRLISIPTVNKSKFAQLFPLFVVPTKAYLPIATSDFARQQSNSFAGRTKSTQQRLPLQPWRGFVRDKRQAALKTRHSSKAENSPVSTSPCHSKGKANSKPIAPADYQQKPQFSPHKYAGCGRSRSHQSHHLSQLESTLIGR